MAKDTGGEVRRKRGHHEVVARDVGSGNGGGGLDEKVNTRRGAKDE